jgi:hypothetical protein
MCVHFLSITHWLLYMFNMATTSENGLKCKLLLIQEKMDIINMVDAT